MKNIFSKTTEKRTQNGLITDSKRTNYGISILLFAFLTLGFGQAWADYYYRGDKNSWGATAMTVHNSGLYEYYSTSAQSFNGDQFKISTSTGSYDYNYTYVAKGFNGGSNNIGDYGSNNCYIWDSYKGYIIVYYPNTAINTTSNPKITFRTSLYSPTFYIKHSWDGSSWTWGTMSRTGEGIYTYTGNCYTANGANVYTSKSDNNYLSPSGTFGVNNGVPAVWSYNAKSNSLSVTPAYTLTVTNDGHGSSSGSVSKGIKMSTKYAISASSPSTGYHFNNWTRVSGGTCTFDNASSASTNVTVTGDASATVQANFALNTYTVAYNANDAQYPGAAAATGSTTSSSHTYDTAKKLTSNGFSRAGYTFAGWATTPTGSVAYTDGQSVTNLTSTHGATVTLYAKWTENKSTITLVASPSEKGTFQVGGETVTSTQAGVTTTPSVTAYPISGYRFTGWSISGGASISSTSDNPTTVTGGGAGTAATLTATFEENLVYYDVTFSVGTSYTSLGSLSATNNTTSSAISSGDDILSASSITFTATPNTGYEVAGFYSDASCETLLQSGNTTTYTIVSLSSNVTVYVKFVEKTWSVAFAAGTGGTVTTPAATPQTVGQVTGISIAATPATGYTFNTWTITSGSGSFTSAATTNSNTFKPTAASTITASFNETKSTITVTTATSSQGTLKFGSTSKSWGATASLGVATTQEITATAAAGFRFVRWDLSDAAASSSTLTNATITLKADGSGSTGTATAVFEEDLSSPWIVAGGNKIVTTGTTWRTTADANNTMLKKTGHSTENVVYFTVPVTTVCSGDNNENFQFKIYNTSTSKWYGLFASGSYYLLKAEDGTEKSLIKDNQNIELRAYVTGDYEFKLDYSTSTPKLTVTWPVFNQVRISAASPTDATNTGNFDLSDPVSNVRSVKRSLNANTTYTFKIVYNSDFYGYNSGTFTRSTSTSSNSRTISTSGGDMTLTTDYAGDYTFRFNQSTKALSVDFPTAYKVTYSKGTVDGSSGSCSAKDIDNGNAAVTSNSTWVKSGNRVVMTAPVAKTGYTYNGWFDNNSGTGTAITINANCTITVSSALTRYACYTINNHAITHSASTHGSYTIQVGSAAAVGTNTTSDYGKTITLAATPATGYHFGSWSAYKTGTPATTITVTSNQFTMPDYAVTVGATFTPNTYTVHFHRNGGAGTTVYQNLTYDAAQNLTANTYTKTGYTFAGWALTTDGAVTYADGANVSNLTAENGATFHLYAKWTPKQSALTFDYQTSAEGYGTSGSIAAVSATYDAAMPALSGTMPTAARGWAFMGFYDAAGGEGKQYYDGTGASVTTWDKDITTGTTLYAYYKKAEITAITLNSSVLDPVDAGGTGWVIANPTVEPTPVLPVKICWELLYDNDNPVPAGHEAQAYTEGNTKPNQVRFSIAGLAASRYKIKATLRTGSSCDGGDELSTRTQTFTIASSFIVNILYQDGDNNNIAPGTTSPGKATDWTTISAPDIFGYTFDGWKLGEGITTADPTDKQNDFRFKASYYGTIVAQYTKNQYIYLDLSQAFSTYDKWDNPYVYFYNGDPWVDNAGAGATGHSHYISGHAMTKIDGTDIWYFDYGGVSGATRYVAFTWGNNTMQENFWKTDVIFRGDFSESTPLFVPATDGTADSRKTVVNEAQYYNKGYWVTYLGEATGYTLLVYNSAGDVELKREPFIAADKRMTMTSTVQLDASSNYKLEILRNDGYYYNKATTGFTASDLGPKAIETGGSKYNIQTNADGIYTFTLGYNSGNLQLSVVYPSGIGDFRIAYTDNATWSHSHTLESWILPSKTLAHRANGVDTVSFFISKGAGITPKIRWEKVTAVSESSVTWGTTGEWLTTGYTDVSEAGVYNFKVTQNADGTSIASIERIGEYDGSYYIRCNALRSKWDHYTIDSDHRMTYSEFSESAANSFGEKYSHYKAKWCPRNTNIAFVIANDYSPCLTDKLTTDVGGPAFNNLEADGTLKYEKTGEDMKYDDANAYLDKYSANVRFMWNRKTNKISRAYVSSATSNNAKFLVLQGSGTSNSNIYNGTTGAAFTADSPGANSVILKDDQNWIYEEVIKANPSALVKLYANYCGQTQWFRGASGTPFEKDVNAVELLGGSPSSSQYAVRVIYDFKTNRLVCAWIPEGASQEIETNLTVNADVMVIREHQGPAQCITFANDKSMTGVKTVYGAMKFNRWILSNRAHPEDTNPNHCRESNLGNDLTDFHPVLPIGQQLSIYERSLYFISFPFDVKASEIFGFGHYWDEWYLEYYDGKTRAKNGYWIDSPPNWKYVTPDMLEDFTLKANEGYILGLDLDFMQVDNTAFWSNGISTVELYFPSTVNLETLKQTNVTIPALSSDYKCTINRGTPEGDRRVKDSYWRCLGVPSFNIYNSALKDGSGNTIEWKTDYTWHADESEFPFIYMWNKADNTLTAQSTSAFNFLPMHAYLVQNGGEINWTAVSAKPSSIVARQESAIMPNEYNWRITLSRDSVTEDQTYVRMTNLEQVTDSFDFGQDLVKELNTGRSDIYTFIGYERVAANSRPIETTQTTIVPMGLNIETTGDYTFSIPEGSDGVGVVLVDETTGVRTSLSALDYTVTLQQGDYTNRFYLEISPIAQTPTGLEEPTSNSSLKGRAQKRIIDGVLYIVRDGKIFDARGARVE